jgi:hypothetical protein
MVGGQEATLHPYPIEGAPGRLGAASRCERNLRARRVLV